ncbi:Endonuclease/Exonuclease/phosphatase family protein [Cyclonatronum proteinivorum]|uniref:Endonuclease/Exonuclease/phosphatase family protein n=1 Tax=Cyclonatronum proteinivorum TaxID=1457365 RepID=A0A345UPV4_9BACT|nr:endonuclease/exonuclease/phosphatase family protein [Cyclonatronum proteinivorum]AXJ02506.1 Endonuclease/Exonuclease/phosphatase family protein [Cyclonatronum proteinivorum]
MKTYYFAWWNVENLFDTEDCPDRPDYLQSRLRRVLEGWTEAVLDQKLNQLAHIILKMNGSAGPDLIGLCEVESKAVIDKLIGKLRAAGRQYTAAHHPGNDNRGIDVAFIYDADLFTFEGLFHFEVLKRSATRDLLQINLKTKPGNHPLLVIGNHWPSRRGGEYGSEPYRIMAAETLSYWMERIFEIRTPNIPVIVMGDFNDEPFNRALTDYALSSNSLTRVRNARIPRLYNLMWPVLGAADGTFYFNNFPVVLDQLLVSRGMLLANAPIRLSTFSDGSYARVEKFPEMVSGGMYPDPIRFGRPASGVYNPQTGYSDHYPVAMMVEERG